MKSRERVEKVLQYELDFLTNLADELHREMVTDKEFVYMVMKDCNVDISDYDYNQLSKVLDDYANKLEKKYLEYKKFKKELESADDDMREAYFKYTCEKSGISKEDMLSDFAAFEDKFEDDKQFIVLCRLFSDLQVTMDMFKRSTGAIKLFKNIISKNDEIINNMKKIKMSPEYTLYDYAKGIIDCHLDDEFKNLLSIKDLRNEIDAENQKSKEPSAKKEYVKPEINQKEQERIKMIEKANDLYGYFVIDFLRDVEKQTPYTARYMVEKLNEKHDKFLKNFEMPLSSDTSIGKANECISQINSMIDYVSKISEASYVVSGYQK